MGKRGNGRNRETLKTLSFFFFFFFKCDLNAFGVKLSFPGTKSSDTYNKGGSFQTLISSQQVHNLCGHVMFLYPKCE